MQVFEYDDVIHHTAHALRGMLSYFLRISAFATIGIRYVWTRIFPKTKKKNSVWIRVDGALVSYRKQTVVTHFTAAEYILKRIIT